MATRKPLAKKGKKAKAKMTRAVSPRPTPTDALPWSFVEIQWRDATSESNWKSQDDLPNLSMVLTRGWLVRSTKVCVTIAASIASIDHSEGDQKNHKTIIDCGEIITIPRGCVCSILELNTAAKPKKKVVLN